MVRYVVELPEHNWVFAWIIVIYDWLRQFSIFNNRSRSEAVMGAVTAVILLLFLFVHIFSDKVSPNAPQPCKYATQCFKCNNRAEQSFYEISEAKCTKCGDKCGFAWKCAACGKYFAFIETAADNTKSRNEMLQKMRLPQCPYCRSTKIQYTGLANTDTK